jgi:Na+/melibiose symporter-like transporter
MPGLIPHLVAGSALYLIGRYSFRKYFDGTQKSKERFLLLFICLLFSIIPDAFLGIYYATNLLPFKTLLPYHVNTHLIITPITFIFFLLLIIIDSKRKPIWFFGICAIVVHIIMDQFIQEFGALI